MKPQINTDEHGAAQPLTKTMVHCALWSAAACCRFSSCGVCSESVKAQASLCPPKKNPRMLVICQIFLCGLCVAKDYSYDPLSTAIFQNPVRGPVCASSTAGAAARARKDRHRTRNRRHRPENLRQFHRTPRALH